MHITPGILDQVRHDDTLRHNTVICLTFDDLLDHIVRAVLDFFVNSTNIFAHQTKQHQHNTLCEEDRRNS